MTSFELVHVFPGLTVPEVFAALVDPAHQAAQDRAKDVERREILARVDDATHYRCESHVYPRRQLPAYIRPLVKGGLDLHEVITWDKATNVLEIEVLPAMFSGRSKVHTTVTLEALGADVRRTDRGTVSVDVAIVGRKIERAVIEEMGRALALGRDTTLAFLGRKG